MKAESLTTAQVFSNSGYVQYVLPHFQREYAWEKEQWQALLSDVKYTYEKNQAEQNSAYEHFMGALVVVPDGYRSGTMPVFKLVDGQQRLTTVSIMLFALIQLSPESLKRKISRLLINDDEEGELRYKLLPTTKRNDNQTYRHLLADNPDYPIAGSPSRIGTAYKYMQTELRTLIENGTFEPERLFVVISNSLRFVYINVEQTERPYEIFESLNAKGKQLTQPDLVRNYIAMRVPSKDQTRIFDQYWTNIEQLLDENHTNRGVGELTAFLRHYLAFRTGVLPNIGNVYTTLRNRMESEFAGYEKFVDELKTLNKYAEIYARLLRPELESDHQVHEILKTLLVLESSTAYPFLMKIYADYETGQLGAADFISGLQQIENYLIRRYASGTETGYTNKMFPQLIREVNMMSFAESLAGVLVKKRYPTDAAIRSYLPTAPLYIKKNLSRVLLILERINRYLSVNTGGYTVLDAAPTIEHIMPQTLTESWKINLGEDYNEVHDELLHTIGNLTLITSSWNSTLSNGDFEKKKHALSTHALRLNSKYFQPSLIHWNRDEILRRAEALTDIFLVLWPSIGSAPASMDVTGTTPKLVTLLGQNYPVSSWSEVTFTLANALAEVMGEEFDPLAQEIPYLSRTSSSRSRQLINGWHLRLNLSAENHFNLCERMITAAGLLSNDWSVERAVNVSD